MEVHPRVIFKEKKMEKLIIKWMGKETPGKYTAREIWYHYINVRHTEMSWGSAFLELKRVTAYLMKDLVQFFLKEFIYFLERTERREKERNMHVWLPLTRPLLGTWPTMQACALTGNGTCDPLVHRPALNPLSHTSQGDLVQF